METKRIKIANFNCTFIANNHINPMLIYFTKIILPALTDPELFRHDIRSNTKYYIADLKLVVDEDGELILIGKHFKRVILEIKQDYNNADGIIPKGNLVPSAPFSMFVIKLSNHRILHFTDQKGSPDLRSLSTTIRVLTSDYLGKKLNQYLKILNESEYAYEGVKYNDLAEFKEKYFKKEFPEPNLDVVPIPSKVLIDEQFKSVSKISSVTFKIFNLNSEIDYEPHYDSLREFMEITQGKSIVSVLNSPKDKEEIKKALHDSKGKTYYKVKAKGIENEDITFDSETIAEQIPIKVNETLGVVDKAMYIYNSIKNRSEIKDISPENKKNI
ncbi:MAG: hypothetical protein ACREV6_05010 [Clostridium sp.]|uniref:hypothetical protein n=1 Tax=Clostridium sp. TaxID=1506 RepID=UPI003D6D19F5